MIASQRVVTPHIHDQLYIVLGSALTEAFLEQDYNKFSRLCTPDQMPKLLWAEAEYVIKHGPVTENKTRVRKRAKADTPFPYKKNLVYGDVHDIKKPDLDWFFMPGSGKQYAFCGQMWEGEYKGCLNLQGHQLNMETNGKIMLQKIAASCGRFECPVCFEKAAVKEAWAIARKFMRMPAYDPMYDKVKHRTRARRRVSYPESRTPFGKPIHLMISPSRTDGVTSDTAKNHKKLMAKVRKIAKKVGFDGGCMIYHPWRSTKEGPKDYGDKGEGIEINLETGGADLAAIRAYYKAQGLNLNEWYFSPHFHLIGYAKNGIDGAAVAANYEETGWVVVNLGVRKSVVATAHYQLSHAGIHRHLHTVTWFGVMSNGKGWFSENALPEIKQKGAECPECKRPLKRYIWKGEGDPPLKREPEGTYWIDTLDGFIEVGKLHAEYQITEDTDLTDGIYLTYPLPPDDEL